MSNKPQKFRYLPATVLVVVVLGLAGGAFALVRGFLQGGGGAPKKVVQEIQIIRPPPPPDLPPPPPPPPEEEVDIPEPEPDPVANDDAAPPEQLGLDAEGGAGGDSFGLLGRKGGRDLLGSNSSALVWYSNFLKGEILDRLQNIKAARSGAYTLSVQLWIRADGFVERAKLLQSTGNRARDEAIEADFVNKPFSRGPPAEAAQPISVKILSRA